ncbi:MAG: hypothetical protein EZS28_046053 [Streblomastix strix]|uniref:Uncharacterized protein n=1 Tax=Streblomastix strix TaxID=222440 RepID=A0A5J4TKR4_9EUKA|nr:MAG: hypothetical protein EZS28_046053 [Streblomastix strix]
MTFSKHLGFAPFVKHFSRQRIQAKLEKNKGLEQQSKISMNSSYGCDDSMLLAVAGDPNQDYTQRFSAIVSNKQFYDENFYKFFPDPNKDVYDEKKLLGIVYEHCGSSLIALAPKNYWLLEDLDKKNPETVKLKVKDKNMSLRQRAEEMSQIEVLKQRITGCHTKMVTLPKQCCCPFIYQLSAESYKCQELQ